ncbi:hypothetical protein [Chondrinema litorale]|uniref:hypothetical protein n=1 Tax=Chondrinema litorale TaxID=2994555 RepID=UPI002543CCC4|nr:hypothetical protein [Chondrinema litorale]UZR99572.1 hypothetical protein OQ292_37555 [Chondrinema litorale]
MSNLSICVFKNSFVRIDYYSSELLLEITWLPLTEHMTKKDYQECFLAYLEIRKNNLVNKLLIDESQYFYVTDFDLQKWAIKLLNEEIKYKVSFVCIILNKYFIQQMLLKLLIEEVTNDDIDILFFTSKADAIQCLLDDIMIATR